jgi:hypothetical protein
MRSQAARQFFALALSLVVPAGLAARPGLEAPAAATSSAEASAAAGLTLSAALSARTPIPTRVSTPAAGAPGAPGKLEGLFSVLTEAAKAPQPTVHLSWGAAEAGDWLIQGYRVFRSTPGLLPQVRGPELVPGLALDDPVELGQVYTYTVEAVDVKGQNGPRSQPLVVDLAKLPDEQLAPRAPEGLTATSLRDTISLAWRPLPAWVRPLSAYLLYRASSPEELGTVQALALSGTAWEERPPVQARDYWFAVAAVDVDGRRSPLSLTVSARATGVLPPGAPQELTASAKTEKVTLRWRPAPAGTAPLSAYLLNRREAEAETWTRVAVLPAQRSDYTDKVSGDRAWLYSLAAVDVEGNTGPAAYVDASPTAKLLNKTLIVVMPTAYANHATRDRGFNQNVLFDFYVGSLIESYTYPLTGQVRRAQFQPLQLGTITSDSKLALLDDRGLIPGLALGFYLSALINFGSGGSAQTVNVSSSGGNIATLGNVYAVLSKRFWPGEPRASAHAGILWGGLADGLASDPTPEDWRLTLRHLLPGGDYPKLFSRFVDPKLGATIGQAPHLAFAGLQLPFTLPLGFTRWRTGIRAELMQPLGLGAEYSRGGTSFPAADPATQLPWLLNLHIDNLPLFGFEFGWFQYPGGYQLIAFYHIPDLTWSW